jgi:hypothetical protein
MTWPAVGSVIPKLEAMSGSRHRDELGGADAESAQREGEHRQPPHGRVGRDDGYRTGRSIK